MHECPECSQACDCDGEDTWNDIGSSDWLNCSHECEEYEEDDLMPGDDEEWFTLPETNLNRKEQQPMFEKLEVGMEVHYTLANGTHSKATVTKFNKETGVVDLNVTSDDSTGSKYPRKTVAYREEPTAYSWHFITEQCPKVSEQSESN